MGPKRILALHGVAQSGPVFQRRCQNIVDHLEPLGFSVHFLTAPHSIEGTTYTIARQNDYIDGDLERSWWTTNDDEEYHPNITLFLETVAEAIRQHGPFVAAMGFSQGGCAATSVAALLEPSRRNGEMARKYLGEAILASQPPLRFLVLFSANPYRFPIGQQNDVDILPLFYPKGFEEYPYSKINITPKEVLMRMSGKYEHFQASDEENQLKAISTPKDNKLTTPALAFYGKKEWDRDIFSRSRQQWLISRFNTVQVQEHPWKHTVPRTDEYAKIVAEFVKKIDEGQSGRALKASL